MLKPITPRRSVLYMPGSNLRAMQKARTLPCDAVILDLEDAVAPDQKELARVQVTDMVRQKGFGKREVIIRINALATPWGAADLAAAKAAAPDAVLVPKISATAELAALESRLGDSNCRLWAMIETPQAILRLESLAAAGGRLSCFVMGTNDLVKELHGRHTEDRAGIAAALTLAVAAARANHLAVLDGVYNDINNLPGFEGACRQGQAFGFDGKTLIHPSQIDPCNQIFAPDAAEVAAARKIIAAFDAPENLGKGAIALDGRMVERLHADIARQTVALADAIAAHKGE